MSQPTEIRSPKTNGCQRNEAVVEAVQVVPRLFHVAEYACGHEKKPDQHKRKHERQMSVREQLHVDRVIGLVQKALERSHLIVKFVGDQEETLNACAYHYECHGYAYDGE